LRRACWSTRTVRISALATRGAGVRLSSRPSSPTPSRRRSAGAFRSGATKRGRSYSRDSPEGAPASCRAGEPKRVRGRSAARILARRRACPVLAYQALADGGWGLSLPTEPPNCWSPRPGPGARRALATARYLQLPGARSSPRSCHLRSVSSVRGADATPYLERECVTTSAIRVGDAGLAWIDLVERVQKAVQTASRAHRGEQDPFGVRKPPIRASFLYSNLERASSRHQSWRRSTTRPLPSRGPARWRAALASSSQSRRLRPFEEAALDQNVGLDCRTRSSPRASVRRREFVETRRPSPSPADEPSLFRRAGSRAAPTPSPKGVTASDSYGVVGTRAHDTGRRSVTAGSQRASSSRRRTGMSVTEWLESIGSVTTQSSSSRNEIDCRRCSSHRGRSREPPPVRPRKRVVREAAAAREAGITASGAESGASDGALCDLVGFTDACATPRPRGAPRRDPVLRGTCPSAETVRVPSAMSPLGETGITPWSTSGSGVAKSGEADEVAESTVLAPLPARTRYPLSAAPPRGRRARGPNGRPSSSRSPSVRRERRQSIRSRRRAAW